MRNIIKHKILGLAFFALVVTACNTAEQGVSSIVSPDGYPVATITNNITNNIVFEGDTARFYIKTDKWLDRSVTFTLHVTGGTAEEHVDYEFLSEEGSAQLAPYTDSVAIEVLFIMDNLPEIGDKTFEYEISVDQLSDRYLINPSTVLPSGSLTLKNYNDPEKLTVTFGWPSHDDDFDCVAINLAGDSWGLAGTSDNPEIMLDFSLADPDDTYYYGVDPYDVSTTVTAYTISIGYPDQTVEFITGNFDLDNLGGLTQDYFPFWDMNFYRILEIVKSGDSYTVTHVNAPTK